MNLSDESWIVREATVSDAESVTRIYNYFVTETIATFEERPVSPDDMAQRVEDVVSSGLPWLVGERDREVCGFAHATRWKRRNAYRFSVETTVYVDPGHVGRGLGSRLYEELLSRLKDRGLHAAMGGIALPNDASIALHEKFGFRKVAHFEQVGYKFNHWIDVGYWERVL